MENAVKKYVCKNKAKLKIVFRERFFIAEKSNYNTQTSYNMAMIRSKPGVVEK